MPEPLVRCHKSVVAQMISRGMDAKKASDAARGICAKSTGLKWKKETFDENNISCENLGNIEAGNNRYSYYGGIALVPGTSLNFITYTKDEIQQSFQSMQNKLVSANHNRRDQPPIGRVVHVELDSKGAMHYVKEIDNQINPAAAKALESGYIDHVSIESRSEYVECSICGERNFEGCRHWRGEEYETKKGLETCSAIARNIEFTGLGVVFGTAGVPNAQIAHTHSVPIFVENLETKRKGRYKNMTEQSQPDWAKIIRLEIAEALKEHKKVKVDEEKQKLLTEQNESYLKQIEEMKNGKKSLEKRALNQMAKDVAMLETKVMAPKYPEDKVADRIKSLVEEYDGKLDKLETRYEHLTETWDNMEKPKERKLKETIPHQKGGFINKPRIMRDPTKEELGTMEYLEAKKLVELSLGFKKPIKEEVKLYAYDYDLTFKKEQPKLK